MGDWGEPDLDDPYSNFLDRLNERDIDAFSLGVGTVTNPPTGAMRYVRATNKLQEWNGSAWVDKVISLAGGGTGAATAVDARTSLGLGTISIQDANNINISGGAVSAILSGNGAGITAINGANIASGVINVARLGTGTANANKVLKGDGTWDDFAMLESIQYLDINYSNAGPLASVDFTLGTTLVNYLATLVVPGPGFYVIGGGDPRTLASAKLINNTTFRFTFTSAVVNISIAGTIQIAEFRT